jgi:hypothetical protein
MADSPERTLYETQKLSGPTGERDTDNQKQQDRRETNEHLLKV